ncbi:MAG: DEAD/DEAH box helicase [Pseudomonadota bacterium]
MSDPASPFAALGLSAALVRAALDSGHTEPTAIQAVAIPALLSGADVWGSAPTGAGKTAAYALPLLQGVDALRGVRRPREARRTHALVLVPTRELAAQVGEVLRGLAASLQPPLKVATLFGGVSINPQMMALRGGAEVVVATPGRLLDVAARNALQMQSVNILVLDEADRLLEAGFAHELNQVLAAVPTQRQTVLFSATFPPAVQALASALLHEPVRVDVPDTAPTPGEMAAIVQRAVEVDAPQRTPLLRHLMQAEGWQRVLVFVATTYASEHVADKLRRQGVTATALHGGLAQGARSQALAAFKAGELQVLVATDLAARGIDIAALPVVVNHDLPRSAVDHLHRIGRTGRAGSPGLAVSFISADTEAHFRLIEKRQGWRVPREQVAGFEPQAVATEAVATGGVKGRRPSKKDKLREAAAKAAPKPAGG